MSYHLEFRWTISRAQDSYGYNICSLWVDGIRVARTCGGGFDMPGTVLGDFIASNFAEELNCCIKREYYGLCFICPEYYEEDVKAALETDEIPGGGLATYQAQFTRSSKLPTGKHTIPEIDGACGISAIEHIIGALGYEIQWLRSRKQDDRSAILSKSA